MSSRASTRTFGCGLAVLVLAVASAAAADDGPKGFASIHFLTELNTVSLTIDQEPFVAWLKPVVKAAEEQFPKVKDRKALVVQITLHHDGPAEVELAGNPALSAEDVKAVEAAADVAKAPKVKVASCSLRIVVKDKKGAPDDLPELTPALKAPRERLLERLAAASTPEGLDLIRRWAIEESLPLLAASANGADKKYVGVQNLGAALDKALADPKTPLSVETLATKNPDFWRATLEMDRRNPLTPAVQTSLLLAVGRVEWARQVAAMTGVFDGRKDATSDLLGFGKVLAETYLKGVNARIAEGIALYDAGKLAEALVAFDAILKDDPQSAWALYERFHTDRTIQMKGGEGPTLHALWRATRAKILASDPMYQTMAEANGQEGFFDLSRRISLGELFKDDKKVVKDVIAYADAALDLEAFDVAGLLYWSILTSIPSKEYDDRPLLESFLYAMERLGVKDLKENFKGDHAAAFAAIEADRRKRVDAAFKSPKPDAAEPQ